MHFLEFLLALCVSQASASEWEAEEEQLTTEIEFPVAAVRGYAPRSYGQEEELNFGERGESGVTPSVAPGVASSLSSSATPWPISLGARVRGGLQRLSAEGGVGPSAGLAIQAAVRPVERLALGLQVDGSRRSVCSSSEQASPVLDPASPCATSLGPLGVKETEPLSHDPDPAEPIDVQGSPAVSAPNLRLTSVWYAGSPGAVAPFAGLGLGLHTACGLESATWSVTGGWVLSAGDAVSVRASVDAHLAATVARSGVASRGLKFGSPVALDAGLDVDWTIPRKSR